MKVVYVAEVFWPYGSGGELATYLWMKLLASFREVELSLVTAKIGEKVEVELRSLGVDVVKIDADVSSRSRFWRSLLSEAGLLKKIFREHDVVVVPRLAYPAIPLAKESGAKTVVHLHDYVVVDPSGAVVSRNYVRNLIEAFGLKKYVARFLSVPSWREVIRYVDLVDASVFVSKRQRDLICSKKPRLCSKHYVIHNPLPPTSLMEELRGGTILEDVEDVLREGYVLFGGGTSRLKGFSIVKLVAKVLKRWGIVVVVTKSGRYLYDKERNLLFLPRISYDEYIKLLSNAKAFLYPSLYEEPLPYAVLEATLMGVPTITTRVGGIPEILGYHYPLYVDRIDMKCIEKVVSILFTHYDSLVEYVERRADYLRSAWSDEKLGRAFLDMLRDVVEGSSPRGAL